MRTLIKLPNELLRKKSEPVKSIDSKVRSLAREMAEFMQHHWGDDFRPVALSAPQLGELVRVIAFRRNPLSGEEKDTQVLINPELVYEKGYHLVKESCLSIPGGTFAVRRAKLVKIRGLTLDGVVRSFRGRDLLAHVFQHELNHLDGVLIDTLGRT